eukprot:TRINITY_DN3699_c0_g1_i2.p1 TRINITY_DN3699_c0_g1~~TRINITY_DN3699_c0_g1_i2.p1  ORF type:complete len:417 (+),score=134.99 TRINITY_DN3699_c0_g1_i2:86-1336(+)
MPRCAALAVLFATTAYGCTWISVPTEDKKQWVVGRSMELGGLPVPGTTKEVNDPWIFRTVPKGTALKPDVVGIARLRMCLGMKLDAWTAKYSYAGIGWVVDGESDHNVYDAVNTEGLTVDALSLRVSEYGANDTKARLPDGGAPVNLCFINFATYVVSNFATVGEVKGALASGALNVLAAGGHRDADMFGYVHWAISDRHGGKIVVEFIDGRPTVHDNAVGTMTNDPHYDWHLRNLDTYVMLGTRWADPKTNYETEIGIVPLQLSHGANTVGLPGDYTPPGRFVRAFYLKEFTARNNPPRSVADAMTAVTGVLNAVFIPKGVIAHHGQLANATAGKARGGAAPPVDPHELDLTYDYTQWNTLKVPGAARFHFRTYEDAQWRMVDLNKVDWAKGVTETFIVKYDTPVRDITSEVNGS